MKFAGSDPTTGPLRWSSIYVLLSCRRSPVVSPASTRLHARVLSREVQRGSLRLKTTPRCSENQIKRKRGKKGKVVNRLGRKA